MSYIVEAKLCTRLLLQYIHKNPTSLLSAWAMALLKLLSPPNQRGGGDRPHLLRTEHLMEEQDRRRPPATTRTIKYKDENSFKFLGHVLSCNFSV